MDIRTRATAIWAALLQALAWKDPFSGSGRPPMYRLRIGDFRAMYYVEEKTVYVTDLFPKKRDSAYREN